MNQFKISIILPAYNEAENISIVVTDIINCMQFLSWDYEIIIVNDGSIDNSIGVIGSLIKNPQIKSVNHSENRGYGAALRSGFHVATMPWIFFMDSDRQFDIREITKLSKYTNDFDMVIGYRKNRQDNMLRKLNATIFNLAVNLLFGLWLKDIDCAFKLIRREIIDTIKLESNGALINTELLVKTKRLGYKIKQLPVSHHPRPKGEQSGANVKVILRAIKEIILFRLTGRTVWGTKQ